MGEQVIKGSVVDPIEEFKGLVKRNIEGLSEDAGLSNTTLAWIRQSSQHGYTYNFSWLGRPIIQYPQDIVAIQELIWEVKPDLIIETGIAHGGSLVFSASMLALLDLADAVESDAMLNPKGSHRKVIGIDIDIRPHNKKLIDAHPMSSRIEMIEGSSVDPRIIDRVRASAANYENIMVLLDSNHTHDHVLSELEAYAPLVSLGSYCVVLDTLIEDMPENFFQDRPWSKGNNPMTAVKEFLEERSDFVVDKAIEYKLQITVAPNGYLKRVAA